MLGETHRAGAESSELWEEIRKTGEEWSGIGGVGEESGALGRNLGYLGRICGVG